MAAELGTLRLGRVSLDGTKMQGNASKHKAMSWGHANKLEQQLEGEVKKLLELAQQADQEAEAEQQELDIPEELQRREERLAAIQEAKEKIEERAQERYEAERAEYEAKLKRRQERAAATGKKVGGKPPMNFTDEESRIMPGANGDFIQGYNAQAVVEQDSHMVVATHVSQATNDKQEMEPALNELKKVEEELGKPEVRGCRVPQQGKRGAVRGTGHRAVYRSRCAPECCGCDGDEASYRLRGRRSKRKSTVETVFGVIKEVLGSSARVTRRPGVHGVESEAAVCPGRRITGVMDELWRRNGRQRHVGGCCWHHDPSRNPSRRPCFGTRLCGWARSLRNPATRIRQTPRSPVLLGGRRSGVALRCRHLADGPTPRDSRLGYREDAARCFQEPGVALRQGGGARICDIAATRRSAGSHAPFRRSPRRTSGLPDRGNRPLP